MEIIELFESLSGRYHLEENFKARLNVLVVDRYIGEDDSEKMMQVIRHAIIDGKVEAAMEAYEWELDTHTREETFKVVEDVYWIGSSKKRR